MWDGSSGATPELTRETRVLPSPIPEFGLNPLAQKSICPEHSPGAKQRTD